MKEVAFSLVNIAKSLGPTVGEKAFFIVGA